MKKILLPILIFALFFSIGCGGSKKGGTDNDLNNDEDAGDTEISDEDEAENDETETIVDFLIFISIILRFIVFGGKNGCLYLSQLQKIT